MEQKPAEPCWEKGFVDQSVVADRIDICMRRCLRSGLMWHAGPPERLPIVQSRRPIEWLEWQSPRRFSFVCRWQILWSEMNSQGKAIVFSLSPPSDRSRRYKPCSGDDKERGRSTEQRPGFGVTHSPRWQSHSAESQSRSMRLNNDRVNYL